MSSLKQDCIRRSSEEREVNREKVGEQLNVERYGLNGYDEWGVIWVKGKVVRNEDYEDKADEHYLSLTWRG